MRMITAILVFLALLTLAPGAQQRIYLEPSQPIEKRVDDLIPRLTLEEKASLLCTTAPAIDRLKILPMNGWNQCLHGIVWTKPTTIFPVNISMAATWDPALIHDVAATIGDEGRAVNNLWPTVQGTTERGGQGQDVTVTADGQRLRHNGLVYRSPVINISRDPRWGRILEAFGEDPYLTSRITVAYVKGMQGDDPKYLKLAATLKHYAVNNQEQGRTTLSAEVPERILMEVEPFGVSFLRYAVADEGQTCCAKCNEFMRIHRDVSRILASEIRFLGTIFQEVSGHPVVFTRSGQIFHSLSPIAAVQFCASFA